MKRVLVISYYWPPSGGSGVQRWVKFSKYLPSEGWQPVIYTPENPELSAVDDTLAGEIPPEVEVIKRPILEPYGIYRKLTGKKGGSEVNAINSSKKKSISLFIRGNFFIPDPRCFWIEPSVKFLKKYVAEHPVDVIVSTAPPHSMHLIARKLSLATGIPWIADFRDPWTKMFYFKHLGLTKFSEWRHHKLEKKVLDDATVIVSVSPFVQREFKEMTSTPVALVTNGYDEDDFEGPAEKDGFFNITHTGLFSKDGNPENLWTVLGEMKRRDDKFASLLRIRLVGKTDGEVLDSIREAGLWENVVNLGYQPHKTAVAEQCRASFLILPIRMEPESKSVLPGKIFEYLASRRPILGIDDKDGAMAGIINEKNAGEVKNWEDKEGIGDFVERHWNAFLKGCDLYNGKDVSEYSRRNLSKKMAQIMNEITVK